MSMTRGWPAYWDISAYEIGLFMEKLAVRGECLLFPKAVIQAARKILPRKAQNGHMRSLKNIREGVQISVST